jgi:hypothetical protein
LGGHAQSSLKHFDYCPEKDTEMLCLRPHNFTELCLDQSKRSINKGQHHPNATITKFHVGKLFFGAWNKGAAVGNTVKIFCTGMFPC